MVTKAHHVFSPCHHLMQKLQHFPVYNKRFAYVKTFGYTNIGILLMEIASLYTAKIPSLLI